MRKILIATIFLVATPSARADLFALYDFTGLPGDQASAAVAAQPSNAVLTAIVRGSGLTANSGDNSINSRAWSSSLDLTDYYGFTITPTSGQTLSLDTLQFTDRRSSTGPQNVVVRVSFDGFATYQTVTSYTLTDTANHRETISLAGVLGSLSTAVSFRIYAYGATNTLGTYRLGIDSSSAGSGLPANLVLTTLVHAPEPGGIWTFGLGLIGLSYGGWRRRSRIVA